ncbi:MAG: integration host factor subunit beta [Myxococcales bacterium]|nr:integration host factor subunit beta [Myxococcales bacterium]MCB9545017.1 integration host factor subunit beta [Myxococcales bacterium]
MTKGELIEIIARQEGFNLRRAEIVVNTIFDAMTDALQRNDRVEIRGFGSFEVRQYEAYRGRNPKTGEEVFVAAKRAPFFKTGKELRERVNSWETTADDDDD